MKKLLLFALVAAMATACQKSSMEQTIGTGILQITPAVANDVNEVKATTENEPNGGKTIAVPALSEFSLTIKGTDYDRTWTSLSDYSADEERLTAGLYDVAIKYGDIAVEGYDKPYFYAEKKGVQVLDRNRTTNVELTATVGNAIVEVVMTPEFKGYFTEHKFTLKTASNEFAIDENPAKDLFVAPQTVKLDCAVKRQSGKEESLATQSFEVKARTRHIVKYDLEKAGSVKVNITLDDTLIGSETVDVELNENA